MKKIIVVVVVSLVGCTHSKKPDNSIDTENTVLEVNDNSSLIGDSVYHLNYFDFLSFENNFCTESPYTMNEQFKYEYKKYLKLSLPQVSSLIPNSKKLYDGNGVYVLAYKKNREYLLVKYYCEDPYFEGYFIVVYNKKGNIMDYLSLNCSNSCGEIVANGELWFSYSRKFMLQKDTIVAINNYYEENTHDEDTTYTCSIQTRYTLNNQTGKFKKITSDTIEKGNSFRFAE
jgi:hypothetical protein